MAAVKTIRCPETVDAAASNPYRLDALAWDIYKAGRYHEAERAIRAVLSCGISDPLFEYHAGLIAYAVGKKEEAAARVKHSLVLNG
jgi:hypothetical protein